MNEFKENLKNIYSEPETEMLFKAVDFADKAHEGQLRVSGEAYIIHPKATAEILIGLGLDAPTIAAALLHDVVEDTRFSDDDIKKEFGEEVSALVHGVTKLEKFNFKSKEEEQAENFRRMFFAMAKDIRVLFIKLADRLHNMRSLKALSRERQLAMAKETLEIYAPLAGKLGISQIKCELEDLCLKFLDPDKFYTLVEMMGTKLEERKKLVDLVVEEIQKIIEESSINGEVFGRPKHLFSIFKKMRDKHLSFEQIYDMIAVRVIVDTVDECYEVLGKIHKKWKPIPGRIKDYIATPKVNLYQSLHTTVVTNYGQPFEIQIRTQEMHKIAEYGIAAHWKYKEKRSDETTFDKRLTWLREVMEWEGDLKDSVDFLKSLKGDLYSGEVLVFTPKGDVVSLPEGSNPIDYAYRIHSGVGNSCVGAIVNSKIVPLTYKLQVGDVVEIMTSKQSKGPSWDWLKIATTNGAKSKIRQFFKREMKEENAKRGKSMLEQESKKRGFNLSELLESKGLQTVFARFAFQSLDEMYSAVGYGAVTTNQIIVKLVDKYLSQIEREKPQEFLKVSPKTTTSNQDIYIDGKPGMSVRFSKCCSPVPGDSVVGFISRGRGVTVHRADCPNVKSMEPERLIEATWGLNATQSFSVSLQIEGQDYDGFLAKITNRIANMMVPITGINARVDKQKNAIINITITLKNIQDLTSIKEKLEREDGVTKVFRKNN